MLENTYVGPTFKALFEDNEPGIKLLVRYLQENEQVELLPNQSIHEVEAGCHSMIKQSFCDTPEWEPVYDASLLESQGWIKSYNYRSMTYLVKSASRSFILLKHLSSSPAKLQLAVNLVLADASEEVMEKHGFYFCPKREAWGLPQHAYVDLEGLVTIKSVKKDDEVVLSFLLQINEEVTFFKVLYHGLSIYEGHNRFNAIQAYNNLVDVHYTKGKR